MITWQALTLLVLIEAGITLLINVMVYIAESTATVQMVGCIADTQAPPGQVPRAKALRII